MADRRKLLAVVGIVLLWLVTLFEVFCMAMAGSTKLTAAGPWTSWFEQWGFPAWFRVSIGVGEVLGGLLLLWPRVAPWAAAGLGVIMLGAIGTVLTRESGPFTATAPAVHLALLGVILVARRRLAASKG